VIEQVLNVSQEEMHDWFSTKREQELPSVLRIDFSSLQSMVRMADTHRAFLHISPGVIGRRDRSTVSAKRLV